MTAEFSPTPFADVNAIVRLVLDGAQAVLGSRMVGMYLDGSLATSAFDLASDIDFVIVTQDQVQGELFEALQAFHDRLSTVDSPWAVQLEGSYISQHALRRYDPACVLHPNLERGEGERLKMAMHDQAWDVHRWVLREHGITITGPDPSTLIDPIAPEQLRQSIVSAAPAWLNQLLEDPAQINSAGYQSYIVLTLSRMLYTLHKSRVTSKPQAVRWALANLDPRWMTLIEQAWIDRHNPDHPPTPENLAETLAMIHFALSEM